MTQDTSKTNLFKKVSNSIKTLWIEHYNYKPSQLIILASIAGSTPFLGILLSQSIPLSSADNVPTTTVLVNPKEESTVTETIDHYITLPNGDVKPYTGDSNSQYPKEPQEDTTTTKNNYDPDYTNNKTQEPNYPMNNTPQETYSPQENKNNNRTPINTEKISPNRSNTRTPENLDNNTNNTNDNTNNNNIENNNNNNIPENNTNNPNEPMNNTPNDNTNNNVDNAITGQ